MSRREVADGNCNIQNWLGSDARNCCATWGSPEVYR